MKRTKFKAVICQECSGKFLRITNTHLWNKHSMTMEEYKEKYPDAPIDAKGLAASRVHHLRDKTYDEIYGGKRSEELREERRHATTKQMKNPDQIEIRKEKCGYEHTEEQKRRLRTLHTKHGYFNYRERALEYYGLECQRCSKTTEDPADFQVHHIDCNNIPTEMGNHELDNLTVLCKKCHAQLHNELKKSTVGFYGINSIEKGVHYIFKGLRDAYGLDITDINFRDTPKRIARAFAEIFSGIRNTKEQVNAILDSAFPCENDEMILVRNIEVFSMCPHHLLPVSYKMAIAYIPSKEKGKVLGISKLSRLAEVLAKRPVIQEQVVDDITNALISIEGCVGAACVAEGVHYCMAMRGVKQPHAKTITSSLKGVFMTKPEARQELMSLIK